MFGSGALDVSPRIGHLHITVRRRSVALRRRERETVILVGLPPGPHRVLFDLADPAHKVITSQTVAFTVPAGNGQAKPAAIQP